MSAGKIQSSAEHTAKLIDSLTASFAAELEQVLVLVNARIRTLIRRIETSETGRVIANQTNLSLALRLKQDILQALERGGYIELAERVANEPLDRLAQQILTSRAKADADVFGMDVNVLSALKQLRLADLLQVGEDAAIQLWRFVVDGVIGARPVLDLVDDIADLLDISEKRARQVYDTAISTFSRQVSQMGTTTGDPDEAFFYVGPVDQKVREFCQERVGKVFSRKAIDAMDNGQLPNVMLTGGGYNCRHMWARVSPLDADLMALVDTGEVQKDVQARLEDSQLVGA